MRVPTPPTTPDWAVWQLQALDRLAAAELVIEAMQQGRWTLDSRSAAAVARLLEAAAGDLHCAEACAA